VSRITWSNAGGIVALVAVLVLAIVAGAGGRRTLPEPVAISATSAQEAFDRLRGTGVRGRVVVVLDSTSHVRGPELLFETMRQIDDPSTLVPVTWGGFAGSLLEAGVARAVYVVVPEDRWAIVAPRVAQAAEVLPDAGGYVKRLDGAPVHFTSEDRFTLPTERVVVIVADSLRAEYDPAFVRELTSAANADVVESIPGEVAR